MKTKIYLESRNFSFASVPLVVQVFFHEMVVVVVNELRRKPIRMSGRRRRVAVQRHEGDGAAVLNARHVVSLLLHQLRFRASHWLRDRRFGLRSCRHTRSTSVQVVVHVGVRVEAVVLAGRKPDERHSFVHKSFRQSKLLLRSIVSHNGRRSS